MNGIHALRDALVELARATDGKIPLILGGGLGLYLYQEHIQGSGVRTLLSVLPEPRATNDIDLFVKTDVLVSVPRVRALSEAIESLRFAPLEDAKYFQWIREDERGLQVKLDLLCGPIEGISERLYTNSLPRIRPRAPRGTLRFHARLTEEAIELDSRAIPLILVERGTDGANVEHTPCMCRIPSRTRS